MALSKSTPSQATTLISGGGEKIKASIAEENISHILARLTNLYDNPIEASLREIFSNAVDATELMPEGNRRTPEIYTPSLFNPNLIIIDHGVGMSIEDVREKCANYGVSDKGDNLKAVGSYGLGGKAPLAYTDSFSVETTKDGVTTSFIMQRVDGEVETEIVSSENTGNPSGTKVTIPVSLDDIPEFVAAINVYKQFSWRNPVLIDGTLFRGSEHYSELGEVTIYEDDDTSITGRIRIRRSELATFFNSFNSGVFSSDHFYYELGGWPYGADGHRYSKDDTRPFVVEIVPALVDFGSSRDSITSNDKLTQVQRRISSSLLNGGSYFEKIFDIFRDFSHAEVRSFLHKLRGQPIEISSEGKLMVRGRYGSEVFSGDVSLMDTKSGANPFMLKAREFRPSIVKLLGWNHRSEFVTYKISKRTLLGTSPYEYTVDRIGDVTKDFDGEPPLFSVSEIASAIYNDETRLVILTEASHSDLKSFVRKRDAFQDGAVSTIYGFSVKSRDAFDQEDMSYAERILGDRLNVLPAKEFFEQTKERLKTFTANRRAAREERTESLLDQEFSMSYLAVDLSEPSEVVKAWFEKSKVYGYFSFATLVRKLKNHEAILIMGSSSSSLNAFMGAVNAGERFTGKELYLYGRKLKSAQLLALHEVKESVLIAPGFDDRSKAASELSSERFFNDSFLSDELKKLTREQLLAKALEFGYVRQELLQLINNRLDGDQPLLQEYFRVMLEHDEGDHRSNISASDARDALKARFGEEELERLLAFRRAFMGLTEYGGTMENYLLRMFMQRQGAQLSMKVDETQPITSFVLDEVVRRLNTAVSA